MMKGESIVRDANDVLSSFPDAKQLQRPPTEVEKKTRARKGHRGPIL